MQEQRRNRRFELQLPLEVVRAGVRQVTTSGQTLNISSCGVLFVADLPVEIGQPIEYVLTLPANEGGHSRVRLKCMGKVVRLTPFEVKQPGGKAVAATLERYEFLRSKVAAHA